VLLNAVNIVGFQNKLACLFNAIRVLIEAEQNKAAATTSNYVTRYITRVNVFILCNICMYYMYLLLYAARKLQF
jgi:hypothetical protein